MKDIDMHILEEKAINRIKQELSSWFNSHYVSSVKDIEFFREEVNKLRNECLEVTKRCISIKKEIQEQQDNFVEAVKKEINEYMSLEHPGMFSKLLNLKNQLESFLEKSKSKENKFDKIVKDLPKSATLFEDVYKMRDEFTVIRAGFEKLDKKLKKIFSID